MGAMAPRDCLLDRLFRRRSKKTSKLRVTGLCVENSPVTGEFPTQMDSYAENVSIWWRHHASADSASQMPRNTDLLFDVSPKRHADDLRHGTHVDGLVQDCSISIAIAMEILQSCTKLSMWCCSKYMPFHPLVHLLTINTIITAFCISKFAMHCCISKFYQRHVFEQDISQWIW